MKRRALDRWLWIKPFVPYHAQISLRNTIFKIKDGYKGSVTGQMKVSNALGYPIGATTMVVAGSTGIVTTGDSFTLGTGSDIYVISAHIETLGNTTSITFAPGLAAAATNNENINFQPHSVEIKVGDGAVTYDEKQKFKYQLDRGKLSTVSFDNEEPMDVRFDFIWEFLTAVTGDPPTVEDALKQRGEASDWVTASADPCEPYAVDIEITNAPDCVGVEHEVILFEDFRWESLNHDARNGQVATTGKCNRTQATVQRVA